MSIESNETQKQILVERIASLLDKESVQDTIEILANVFMRIGINYTDIEAKKINQKTIYKEILSDIKKNGDTLGNALVRQGLVILDWLNEGKKYD